MTGGLLFLLAAALPFFAPLDYQLSATSIYLYITLAVSWTIFCGPTGYISLASATFYGIGLYTTALMGTKVWIGINILCGGFISLVVGLVVGLICLRLSGFYFAVFTFGLSELVRHTMLWFEHNVGGTVGQWIMASGSGEVYYYMLGVVTVTVLVSQLVKSSKFGLALLGIGSSEVASEHVGVNVTRHRIVFFALSCAFMGMAGAVMGHKFSYIDPDMAFNPLVSFAPALMSLFGGVGRQYGPILGAFILTFIAEILLSNFPYLYPLIYGLIFIIVIMFLPSGLAGLFDKIFRTRSASGLNGVAQD